MTFIIVNVIELEFDFIEFFIIIDSINLFYNLIQFEFYFYIFDLFSLHEKLTTTQSSETIRHTCLCQVLFSDTKKKIHDDEVNGFLSTDFFCFVPF